MFLVYVQGHRGPQAQKVPELVPDTRTGQGRYLAAHPIPVWKEQWPIDALAVEFPAPKVAE